MNFRSAVVMYIRCLAAWCGQCYENVRGRANHKGHRAYRCPPRPVERRGLMSTRPWEDDGAEVEVVPEGHPWAGALPGVWGFLTARTGAGGRKLTNATITLLVEQGVVKACLNDRAADRSLWRSGGTLEEALSAIEESIQGGHPDWRYYAPSGRKGKRP